MPYAPEMCSVRLDLTFEDEQDGEQNLTTPSLKRHQDKKGLSTTTDKNGTAHSRLVTKHCALEADMHADADSQNIPTANANQALKSNIHSGNSLRRQDTLVVGILISVLTFPGPGINLQMIASRRSMSRLPFEDSMPNFFTPAMCMCCCMGGAMRACTSG
jgi:hypothetical protein